MVVCKQFWITQVVVTSVSSGYIYFPWFKSDHISPLALTRTSRAASNMSCIRKMIWKNDGTVLQTLNNFNTYIHAGTTRAQTSALIRYLRCLSSRSFALWLLWVYSFIELVRKEIIP